MYYRRINPCNPSAKAAQRRENTIYPNPLGSNSKMILHDPLSTAPYNKLGYINTLCHII